MIQMLSLITAEQHDLIHADGREKDTRFTPIVYSSFHYFPLLL
jgi:hypothetical protein